MIDSVDGSPKISHTVFKNTFLNLATQGFLLVVTIVAVKFIVPGLSEEKFGLLSIIWVFIGYFTLLDFGISRAVTKFLSESTVNDDRKRSGTIVWTSLAFCAGLGIVLAVILALLTPFIVRDVLKVAPAFQRDARVSLFIAAGCLPLVLLYGALRGVMMALQKFFLTNVIQGGVGIAQWVGALILVLYGKGVVEIIVLTLVIRILSTGVSLLYLPSLMPGIFNKVAAFRWSVLKELSAFGGWITVTQIVAPVILYLDRILIGSMISLAAVTYYSVPQEAITRLLILPMSLSLTLFPAMSGQFALNASEGLSRLYFQSLRFITYLLLPCVVVLVAFSHDFLDVWMGSIFADQSTRILQIFSVGLLFNGIAQIPATVLHAIGRPDLTAKANVAELPIAIFLNYMLIPRYALAGAAIAWLLRIVLDVVLLLWLVRIARKEAMRNWFSIFRRKMGILFLLSGAVIGLLLWMGNGNLIIRASIALSFCTLYLSIVWLYSLTAYDRQFFSSLSRKFLGTSSA
jgi:O-antigen/teichoic acid export membrane protein